MRKAVIVSQAAVICSLAVKMAKVGADWLDLLTLIVVGVSCGLNLAEEAHHAK